MDVANELLNGFQFGFRIGYQGPILGGESNNLISILRFPVATKEKNHE